MSGPYCSLVIGISKCLGTLFGLFAPNIANFLIPNHSVLDWRICFCVFSSILFSSGLLFSFLSKGDLEEWAKFKRYPRKPSELEIKFENTEQRRNHTRKLIRQFSIDSRTSFVPPGFKDEDDESTENIQK